MQPNEVNVWMYCCVASALANEMPYATNALEKITKLLPDNNLQMKDPRFLFCAGKYRSRFDYCKFTNDND